MFRRAHQSNAHDELPAAPVPVPVAAAAIHIQSLSCTKPVLSSILHAPLESYKGGQGTGTVLTSRDRTPRWFERTWKARMFTTHGRYWMASIFTIRGRAAPILPQLAYALYCALVVVVTIKVLKSGHNVDGKPDRTYREWMDRMKALQYPIASIGTALFLLLAFRTNSCYDRWWEGRKLLDGINAKSLDLSRMALAFVAPLDPQLAHQMLATVIVTAHAIKWNLRREKALEDVQHLLEQEDVEELAAALFPVQTCANWLGALVSDFILLPKNPVPPPLVAMMDGNVRGLIADASACARIVTTPMPFAYIVHLRSFMILWLAAVPWALLPSLSYQAVWVACVIGYQLLGFEEIGVEIESPFGYDFNDLPVDFIVRDLQAVVEEGIAALASGAAAAQRTRRAAARRARGAAEAAAAGQAGAGGPAGGAAAAVAAAGATGK